MRGHVNRAYENEAMAQTILRRIAEHEAILRQDPNLTPEQRRRKEEHIAFLRQQADEWRHLAERALIELREEEQSRHVF